MDYLGIGGYQREANEQLGPSRMGNWKWIREGRN